MNVAPLFIAKVQYHTFGEWITALHNVKFLLLFVAVAAFVIVNFLILRDERKYVAYFRGKFWQCQLPLAICIIAAVVEQARLQWNWRSYYRSVAEAEFFHILVFGLLLSAITTVIYSLNRNRHPAS